MGIVIRQAVPSDARDILHCLAAAFEPYRTRYTSDAYRDTVLTEESVLARLSSMRILVAVATNDQVVGTIACAQVSPGEGHLRGMAVMPGYLGHGIAQQLLGAAEAELTRQGCSRITLDTTEPLQRAAHFYEKHGYSRSGRTTDFFGMPLHEYVKEIESARR
jgi:ribosomal protein S18 acetylase RimI-like enzyme